MTAITAIPKATVWVFGKIWKGGKHVWELFKKADVPENVTEAIPAPPETIAQLRVRLTRAKLETSIAKQRAALIDVEQTSAARATPAARTADSGAAPAARTAEPAAARTAADDAAAGGARTAEAPPPSQAEKLAAGNKALGEKITRADLKRQLKEAKKAAKASGKAPILPARVINALTLGIVTPRMQKYILWGAGGWYLSSAGKDWAEKNPEKWATTFASLKKLFGGDLTDVDKISFPIKEIVSSAGGSAVDDLSAAWEGAKDTIKGALSTAPPAKAPAAAEVTAKAPAVTTNGTTKTNGGTKGGPTVVQQKDGRERASKGNWRNKKGPPLNIRVSPTLDETFAGIGPDGKPVPVPKGVKVQKGLKISTAPKKLTDAQKLAAVKKKHGKYSKEAGVAWGKMHGIDISYDPPGGSVKDYEEGLKAGTISKKLGISKKDKLTRAAREDIEQLSMYRHGGSVSSDSYMLRKKPKTTSEVKKGSRQSRSWNY